MNSKPLDRETAIARIRTALKRRSTKTWSVTGGTGTAYGWIDVQAPPRRRNEEGYTTEADRAELAAIFGVAVPERGLQISPREMEWYVAVAEGTAVSGGAPSAGPRYST